MIKPGEPLPDSTLTESTAFGDACPMPPQKVSVAGSFNNWSADANQMRRGGDGVWRAAVPLAEGVHHYKFVVDGSNWVTDPKADASLNEGDN
jgi:1,4-alpha-glucan branching enzyme